MEEQRNSPEEFTSKDNKLAGRPMKGDSVARLDNFWYHYKWHTLAAVFGVVVLLICLLQMCGKESGDISILQVGDVTLGVPYQEDIKEAMSDKVLSSDDYRLSFITYRLKTDGMTSGFLGDTAFTDKSNFKDQLALQNGYICLFSSYAYEESKKLYDAEDLYRPLSDFMTDTTNAYDAYAIELGKTDLQYLPGFKLMPKDTLLCFRHLPYFGKKGAEDSYKRHEYVFKAMLAYRHEDT